MKDFKKVLKNYRGPYKITGKKGEIYIIQDIAEIIPVLGSRKNSIFSYYFYFNNHEKSCIFRFPFYGNRVKFQSFLSFDSGVLNNMVLDITSSFDDEMFDLEIDEHGNKVAYIETYRHFRITHLTFPHLFDGMSDEDISWMLYELAKGRLERARSYFEGRVPTYFSLRSYIGRGSKKKNCLMFRHMSTTQERRFNVAHSSEYGDQIVRGRRKNVPDAWEDIKKSRQPYRSWKQKKVKKQWQKNLK